MIRDIPLDIIDDNPYNPRIGDIRQGTHGSHPYIWQACCECGKERWVALFGEKPQSIRCKSCANRKRLHKRGPGSPNWRGGRVKHTSGYIWVRLQPDDFFFSMANKQGYVPEHRLVVAKCLGRCLQLWELVHHKHSRYPAGSIEDKQDNRYPENLQLVTDDRHKQITILEHRIKKLELSNEELHKEVKLLRWQIKELKSREVKR